MKNTASSHPAERQVLANLGNRFVLFGSMVKSPQKQHFRPEDLAVLPRVADESEVAESRIVQTLQVSGMTRSGQAERDEPFDVELVDPAGNRLLIDIKVQERDPKRRDLDTGLQLLKNAESLGHHLEVWFFNTERLKITIMWLDESGLKFDELVPLNVWEKTENGTFSRQRVVDEVNDWVARVESLYLDIEKWLTERKDLRLEKNRTVLMSEEMMQKFAVVDRELPILDVLRDNVVAASFVPRGLWLIGAWGRIDIITKDGTFILVAIKVAEKFEWRLTPSDDRRKLKPFDKLALLALVGDQ